MMPGPPLRKECPYCHEVKELLSLISGNTFNGEQWSDTKSIYPMLPHNSEIQKCPSCGKYYFLSDAKTLPEGKERSFSMDTGHLGFDELREAYNQLYESASEDRKFILRLNLLYAFNDKYVRQGVASIDSGDDWEFFVDNCKSMLKMEKTIPTLRAELYREIGEFEQCVKYLDTIEPAGEFENKVRDMIRERALSGNRDVFRL